MRDVLYLLLPLELEFQGQLVLHFRVSSAGNADSAGLGQSFQPSRDIDPVAVEGFVLHDHVAQINPDSEAHPALLGQLNVPFRNFPLHFRGAGYCIHHAAEFGQ